MDADLQEVLERLADGELLAEVAQDVGVKRTTLYMRFQATPEMADAYARARQEGLLTRGERLRSMVANATLKTTPSGGVDPGDVSRLKLIVDTEKWTLARLAASVFGDKVEQTIQGPNGGPVQIDKIERVIIDPKK